MSVQKHPHVEQQVSAPSADSKGAATLTPPASGKRRHFSLLRDLAPADFLTLGNAACGMGAILCCLRYAQSARTGALLGAFVLLPAAFILDALDGYVARKMRRSSAYGGDLDSLADIVSFGVAPAAVGFAVGLGGGWDAACLCFFVACCVGRLARFNVSAPSLANESGKVSHFEGTPVPTSLLLVAMLGVAVSQGAVSDALWWGSVTLVWTLHPLALLYVLSGSLMVTASLKIPKP